MIRSRSLRRAVTRLVLGDQLVTLVYATAFDYDIHVNTQRSPYSFV